MSVWSRFLAQAWAVVSAGIGCTDAPVDPTPVTSCPEADPTDLVADDAALQACLDRGGTVTLYRAEPGYLLARGLVITVDETTLTGAGVGARARLVAAPALSAPLVTAQGRRGFVLRSLELDGNRPNRPDRQTKCTGYRGAWSTIMINDASGFAVDRKSVV